MDLNFLIGLKWSRDLKQPIRMLELLRGFDNVEINIEVKSTEKNKTENLRYYGCSYNNTSALKIIDHRSLKHQKVNTKQMKG